MNNNYKLITHAIKEAMKHTKSSPETKEEINQLKLFMELMQRDIKFIKEELVEIKEAVQECNKKYASKWVERAMTFLIAVLVLAALYTILSSAGLSH